MRNSTSTKIFLDSGDPLETKKAVELLGFLDGQTTNPSLIAQNLQLKKKIEEEGFLEKKELLEEYQSIVKKIRRIIPEGSISIEVYSDLRTSAKEMINQAEYMRSWISNPHIKLPTTLEGLKAAKELSRKGVNINMTLCFTQQQAAAVYSATENSLGASFYVSPFIGRLDDQGLQGMDTIKNIRKMYMEGDSHVKLLAASIRSIEHFNYCIYLGVDIITAPLKILQEWNTLGQPRKEDLAKDPSLEDYRKYLNYSINKDIPYEDIELGRDYKDYNINYKLTEVGVERFASDWNKLLKK